MTEDSGEKKEEETAGEGESFFITNYPDMRYSIFRVNDVQDE